MNNQFNGEVIFKEEKKSHILTVIYFSALIGFILGLAFSMGCSFYNSRVFSYFGPKNMTAPKFVYPKEHSSYWSMGCFGDECTIILTYNPWAHNGSTTKSYKLTGVCNFVVDDTYLGYSKKLEPTTIPIFSSIRLAPVRAIIQIDAHRISEVTMECNVKFTKQ